MRYLVTAFVFLLLGGLEAALMRAQLARPDQHLLSPEAYNQLFTMHGTTMIFWYAAPILSGFSNYLVAAHARLARHGVPARSTRSATGLFLLSGIFLYASLARGPDAGSRLVRVRAAHRARYSPALNMDFYALG